MLSLLVCSFTLDAYMEGKAAIYVRNRHQATALLDSGVVLAEMLMERQEKVSGEETEEEVSKDRWIAPAIRLKRGQRVEVSQRLYRDEQGQLQFDIDNVLAEEASEPDAEIFIAIEPEPARWNLNKLARAGFGDNADLIWSRILTVAGVPDEDQSELVDSFYDWVDDDSITVSSEGAESDYYEALTPPYTCKNGPLDTVGELAYIKGFNRNGGVLLKGGVWNPEDHEDRQISVSGIEHLFSLYGSGKINVNAASREVLLTVPCLEDADGLIVDTILEEREGLNADSPDASARVRQNNRGSTASLGTPAIEDYHFTDLSDFLARIPGISQEEANTYLTVDCSVYKLELEGRVGRVRRRATAVVQKGSSDSKSDTSSGSKSNLVILRWQEET
ncbi:MAG: general secretion pathway protein GspK [Kiritimatiellae bacterium]|nr:general secretion pathway protein GspK [Kiritimatiellia bacterium]MBR4946841.1 general secretion pathway protein GspK [Kiritimatiellia bacterium]MBR5588080.1 general secretion pathway protein GspK [Kiritimatiellia bacterium]